MATDFSRVEREAGRLGLFVVVSRCRVAATAPGVLFVPAGATQAELDQLALALTGAA